MNFKGLEQRLVAAHASYMLELMMAIGLKKHIKVGSLFKIRKNSKFVKMWIQLVISRYDFTCSFYNWDQVPKL